MQSASATSFEINIFGVKHVFIFQKNTFTSHSLHISVTHQSQSHCATKSLLTQNYIMSNGLLLYINLKYTFLKEWVFSTHWRW